MCLRKDTVTTENLIKKKYLTGAHFSAWQEVWWFTGRHGARKGAESSTSQRSVGSRKRERATETSLII